MTRILIIEDSKTYNNTLYSLLEKPSFDILQAYSLKEAKNILNKNNDIDIILLDLILPDGEGDELIHEITSTNDETKIIVLSGDKDIQRRNYLFNNGVIDFFSKEIPFKNLIPDIKKSINNLVRNKNKNILIVDDSSFIRKSLKKVLETKNYSVFTSNDPIEAFDVLKNTKIDLIFSDLEMPKMDGIKFLELLKASKQHKNIAVLILSGNYNNENYSRVLKHGAIDFIKKPFIIEEILLKTDLHISQSSYILEIAKKDQELKEYKKVLFKSAIVSKTDPDGKIIEVNDRFCEISGYDKKSLIGQNHNIIRHPDVPKELFEKMWENIIEKNTFSGILKNIKKDGREYYVDTTISPILDLDNNIKEIIAIRYDITDVMNSKKQLLEDLNYLDNPNLIFLQITNYNLFKELYAEDELKIFDFELKKIINIYFPKNLEIEKIYNLENGLFASINNTNDENKELENNLEIMIKDLTKKGIIFKNIHYDINVCISYAKKNPYILDDLSIGIQHAIKNKLQVIYADGFHIKVKTEARNKLKYITMIKNALDNKGKFVSYFQAIINNTTKEIDKYESLIRLIDKDGNVVSPYFFLDIAKKTGYYTSITKLVINNSFEALKHTKKSISINLSSSDIENKEIRELLYSQIIKKENHGRIIFELLEDEDINDFDLVKNFIIKSKKDANVKIAIDDFGSGYSNYERLLAFQPDILKIDGSLIKNIVDDEYSRNVVESIVLFAKKQNIQTIAEFVENKEIFEIIKEIGIDYSQGFYFHQPQRLY